MRNLGEQYIWCVRGSDFLCNHKESIRIFALDKLYFSVPFLVTMLAAIFPVNVQTQKRF